MIVYAFQGYQSGSGPLSEKTKITREMFNQKSVIGFVKNIGYTVTIRIEEFEPYFKTEK